MGLRKNVFEYFALNWLSETEGHEPDIYYVAESKHDNAYQKKSSMDGEET